MTVLSQVLRQVGSWLWQGTVVLVLVAVVLIEEMEVLEVMEVEEDQSLYE